MCINLFTPTEDQIKAKWERVFVQCGNTWEDYLAIRRAEREELEKLSKNEKGV